MRLWHRDLIKDLPREQILGQNSECAGMRGNGWGKKHSAVDYVFTHDYSMLYWYHMLIIEEMERRGYNPDPLWKQQNYRGKVLGFDFSRFASGDNYADYPEHDAGYYAWCVNDITKKLAEKGVKYHVSI